MSTCPDLSAPYKTSGKIAHRAWFSPSEYKQLYKATGERAENPLKERWRSACEDLHDFVLFMVNSGLRPDEAKRIEVRDIEIAADGPKKQRILHIAVRGEAWRRLLQNDARSGVAIPADEKTP